MKRKPIEWIRQPRPYPEVIGDCMICTSHAINSGYPEITMQVGGIRDTIVRIIMRRRYNIQDPKINARHTCDRRRCINPDHIIPGTFLDNMKDKILRKRYPIGDNHKNSKLKEVQVIEIKRLLSCGVSHPDIAKQFGVARSSITRINLGVHWRHVK